MKIGKYKLNLVEAGTMMLDGGAIFGVVPKNLWKKDFDSDENNRIQLTARCLLATSDNKKILVDTGIGSGWDENFCKIYQTGDDILQKSLINLGVTADEITDVFLTHLHFDHCGGSVIWDNGKFQPAFPNAKYHIQKKQFEWALNPCERDKASYFPDRFMPVFDSGLLNLTDGEFQFDDEISIQVVNGHTFAMQMLKFSDSGNTVLFAADFLATSAHIPLPYIMAYDLQPLITLLEKKTILTKAAEENWRIIFEHDCKTAAATLHLNDKGFGIKERFSGLEDD